MALANDLTVRGAAIEALSKHDTPQTREFLQSMLADPDNGIRLAAVTSLGEMMPNTSDVEPLKRCYDSSTGDGAVEIRFNVLRNVAKIGGDPAMAILVAAFADPNPFVRRVARDELQRAFPDMKVTKLDVKFADAHPAAVPVAGRDFPLYEKSPVVDVVTSRGTMTFELFPQEAPVHVFNFLKQIEAKHYDGLDFHRVVPDFVIQGGDYRGDGNGGGTWRGSADALRHEVTPRKYIRGSLGMPRNEDFESGGSQFFVTHRPTPHLDGRYTIFGELRRGFEVLDAIEVGDKILSVRVRK
jgi:cyclophilin family peptidyl-prolyl cis-trans isomerase